MEQSRLPRRCRSAETDGDGVTDVRTTIQVGQPLPELILRDADERPVRVSDLWREEPIVLVFLRHFG